MELTDQAEVLSEREQRFAKATALVALGESYRRAAAECGVPHQTLYSRMQSRALESSSGSDRERLIRAAEERILNATLATAEAAQAELQRRVVEAPESIPTKELVPIAGMSQDKIALQRGWQRGNSGDPHGINSLASKLAEIGGGSVTLTVTAAQQAIDVEGRRVESE